MDKIFFKHTEKLHEWIIHNSQPEDLVLTAGGRMARQILDLFRKYKLATNVRSWLPIQIMSLNEWLKRTWIQMWPEHIQASELRRLSIWLKAIEHVPPPAGQSLYGLNVAKALDETYATLLRHLIDPCKRDVTEPITRWSYEVNQIFIKIMTDEGLIHPVEIFDYISSLLSADHINEEYSKALYVPKRVILAGLDQAAPAEMKFFSLLESVTRVVWLEIQGQADQERPKKLDANSLPDAIQEVEWVVEKALESSMHFPLHRIGIAVSDMKTYGSLFERVLEELLGERAGEGWSSFNITLGRPLIRSSLVQAALLPIRLGLEGQGRAQIHALTQSPYYGVWALGRHKLAHLDRIWRKININRDLDKLISSIKGAYPKEATLLKDLLDTVSPLLSIESKHTAREWNKDIFGIWCRLGFPVLATQEDHVAWEHLKEGIRELDKELGEEPMNLKEYSGWLIHFLSNKLFSSRGYENAGLQIMGLIEARNLSFDQLFIVGMVSGALPQPARLLPFLSPEERRHVQGGTTEDQCRFARVLFRNLIATAPNITLSRPEQTEGEPLVPSPFFLDEEKKHAVINLWYTQSPIWSRSLWLAQTRRGVVDIDNTLCDTVDDSEYTFCSELVPIPPSVSVSALQEGIACAFRFFALHCLGLRPLEEPESGILPRVRGDMIHRCLAVFVEKVLRRKLDLINDWSDVKQLLKEVALSLLSPLSDSLSWHVELKRWLDETFISQQGSLEEKEGMGLLYRWLEEEKNNWEKGFRWLATEVPFSDLVLGAYKVKISGRIDRIDQYPDDGFICWDYKTGQIPSQKDIEEFRASQILPYLIALRKGLTHIRVPYHVPIRGGFIRLESASNVKIAEILINDMLEQWEAKILELFDRLATGDVRPIPVPIPTRNDEGACKRCPVQVLCGYKLLRKVLHSKTKKI